MDSAHPTPPASPPEPPAPPSPANPPPRVADRDLARRVFAALPPLDRQLLSLHHADGLTLDEIAAVYAPRFTRRQAGSRLRAAATRYRRRLRAALAASPRP